MLTWVSQPSLKIFLNLFVIVIFSRFAFLEWEKIVLERPSVLILHVVTRTLDDPVVKVTCPWPLCDNFPVQNLSLRNGRLSYCVYSKTRGAHHFLAIVSGLMGRSSYSNNRRFPLTGKGWWKQVAVFVVGQSVARPRFLPVGPIVSQ